VGHAVGAISYSAALLGWRVRPVPEVGDRLQTLEAYHHLGS
jgi:hypothetical protein